jgi:hypothetical protein
MMSFAEQPVRNAQSGQTNAIAPSAPISALGSGAERSDKEW